jgi:hypothetical protein
MPYINSFQLFDVLNITPLDLYARLQIKEVKKMWKAEFELNENAPVKIGNNYYGSGEVGQLLDRIDDPQVYDFELKIFKCFELLFFLSEAEAQQLYPLPALPDSYYKEDFVRYVSPLLAPVFSYNLEEYLYPYRASVLRGLFTFYNLMTEEDLRISVYKINIVIERIVNRLYDCVNHYRSTNKIPNYKIDSSISSWDIVLLNTFPLFFQPRLDELAGMIMELYEGIKDNPDSILFSRGFIKKAFDLNTSKMLKDRLEKVIIT